ncbi:hypothetical protein MASR1M107_20060 [Ignavibacteriales bacterium]
MDFCDSTFSFAFPVFNLVSGWVSLLMIICSAGVLVIYSVQLLKSDTGRPAFKKAFMGINYFVLYLVLVVSIDKLIPKGLF